MVRYQNEIVIVEMKRRKWVIFQRRNTEWQWIDSMREEE